MSGNIFDAIRQNALILMCVGDSVIDFQIYDQGGDCWLYEIYKDDTHPLVIFTSTKNRCFSRNDT